MIFGVLNPEKIRHTYLVWHLPTSPVAYTVATLPRSCEIQKIIFHTYLKLFTLSQKKTNCYLLTHHTWKMLPHYLLKCTTFSFDWRYVAFLQMLAALKKSRLWVGIIGSEKKWLWCVANGMSSKQHYSKCSKWPPSARIHASSFSPLINCIVDHAVLKFSPCCNKTQQNASATRL